MDGPNSIPSRRWPRLPPSFFACFEPSPVRCRSGRGFFCLDLDLDLDLDLALDDLALDDLALDDLALDDLALDDLALDDLALRSSALTLPGRAPWSGRRGYRRRPRLPGWSPWRMAHGARPPLPKDSASLDVTLLRGSGSRARGTWTRARGLVVSILRKIGANTWPMLRDYLSKDPGGRFRPGNGRLGAPGPRARARAEGSDGFGLVSLK